MQVQRDDNKLQATSRNLRKICNKVLRQLLLVLKWHIYHAWYSEAYHSCFLLESRSVWFKYLANPALLEFFSFHLDLGILFGALYLLIISYE